MVRKYTKRRKAYRKARKRVYRRRRTVRKAGDKVAYIPVFPPSNMRTTMKYREARLVAATAGTAMGLQYRTAGIYDPYYSSTGGTSTGVSIIANGQPGWFDQYKNWYRAYIVDSVRIGISVTNTSASPVLVQICTSNTESQGAISTSLDWSTLRNCNYKGSLIGPAGSSKTVERYRFNIDNYGPCGANQYDKRLTQANPLISAVGTDPTLGPLLQIKLRNTDSGVNIQATVTIVFSYNVRFIDVLPAVGGDT